MRDAVRQNPAHRVGVQRGVADPAAGADPAEQRPGLALGHRLPGLERPHRAGLDMLAPRQADLGPLPRLVGLAPRRCAAAARRRRRATSSTCSATSSERRSAPAKPNSSRARSRRPRAVRVAGGEQLAQHGEGQRRGLLRRPAVAAQQAVQRFLDVAMRRVPRQVVEAVHLAQCREPAADGARRMAVGEAGEIGADHGRRGRHRHEAVRGAPLGEMLPVGLVGAQRGRRRGLARQRLGRGQGGCPAAVGAGNVGNPVVSRDVATMVPVRTGGSGGDSAMASAAFHAAAAAGKPNNCTTRDKGTYRA